MGDLVRGICAGVVNQGNSWGLRGGCVGAVFGFVVGDDHPSSYGADRNRAQREHAGGNASSLRRAGRPGCFGGTWCSGFYRFRRRAGCPGGTCCSGFCRFRRGGSGRNPNSGAPDIRLRDHHVAVRGISPLGSRLRKGRIGFFFFFFFAFEVELGAFVAQSSEIGLGLGDVVFKSRCLRLLCTLLPLDVGNGLNRLAGFRTGGGLFRLRLGSG